MRGILSPTRILTIVIVVALVLLFRSQWEDSATAILEAGQPIINSPPVVPFGGNTRPLATTPHPDEEAAAKANIDPETQKPVESPPTPQEGLTAGLVVVEDPADKPKEPPASKPKAKSGDADDTAGPVNKPAPKDGKAAPYGGSGSDAKPAQGSLGQSTDSDGEPSTSVSTSKPSKAGSDIAYDDLKIAIVTFVTQDRSYVQRSLRNKAEYTKRHNYTLLVDYSAPESRGVMWYKFTMLQRAILENKYDWVWWVDFDTLMMNLTRPVTDVIKEELEKEAPEDRDDIDFFFTPDCFPLNAGSMLMRAHPRVIPFFNLVRAYHDLHRGLSEQGCIRDIIYGPGAKRGAKVLEWASFHPEKQSDHEADLASPAFILPNPAYPDHIKENAEKFQAQGIDDYRFPVKKRVRIIQQRQINAFPTEIHCHEANRPYEDGDLLIHFAGAWAHMDDEDPTGILMVRYGEKINYD